MVKFDINKVNTPYYATCEELLIKNLEILKSVKERTNCKILLAQKAFSMYHFYPLISRYLDGATASGIFEAKLSHEEMGGENHIFSPAYKDSDFDEIVSICDHIVFNSPSQWVKFKDRVIGKSCGLRINPEYSTQPAEHDIYNPCAKYSRLGTTLESFKLALGELDGLDGLHFHTLCQQNSDDLAKTLAVIEDKFGEYLHKMKWLNFGGGHHITREDYDVDLLVSEVNRIKEKYDLQVYLEPGEAVALNAGFLVAQVLEIIENDMSIAILDTSAACHMPDVLEMPYRPFILGSGEAGDKPYTYRFGGPTCLAGDIIGDYSFDTPLSIGDKLIFTDMSIYSMVKNNTFNGMPLPSIVAVDSSNKVSIVKEFGYSDFKCRL